MATRYGSATVSLPSDTEIVITRSLEAPLPLVWDTLTQPRHLLRWWGPDWCPITSCEVDLRPGGSWRYVCHNAEGVEFAWHGTYTDVQPPYTVETTEVFEGFPDAVALNRMTLTEHDGVTTITTLVRYERQEFRDGHINAGMERGMQLTMNRLDDLLASSGTSAERFRRVAGRFTDRIDGVAPDAWDNPTVCDGWVARDVVRHVVEWVPAVIGQSGVTFPTISVDAAPAEAWAALRDTLQAALDDPESAARRFHVGPPGEMSVEQAIGMIVLGDVLVHTWDLARATGQDETLDAGIVHEMLEGMQSIDEMLRVGGQYGPKVTPPDGADETIRLMAFLGRRV